MDKYINALNKVNNRAETIKLLLCIIGILLVIIAIMTTMIIRTHGHIEELAEQTASARIEQKERTILYLRRQVSELEWERDEAVRAYLEEVK